MKIKEYTALNFQGMNGSMEYNYDVLKFGDNLYYKDYTPDEGIRTETSLDGYISHFKPGTITAHIEFLKTHFNEYGKWRNLENCVCCGRQISRPTPEDSNICYLCKAGFMGKEPIVGATEAANILGWDRKRITTYMKRGVFPAPMQRISAGPLWTRQQIEDYRDSRKS